MKIPKRVYSSALLVAALMAVAACQVRIDGVDGNQYAAGDEVALPPIVEHEEVVEPGDVTVQSDGVDEESEVDEDPDADKPIVVSSEDLIFGKDGTVPAANWTKPVLGETYLDPAYQTAITRVSSADGDRFNRNTYSRRQAENADGTLFFTYHGSAKYHVYEVGSNELVAELGIHPDGDPQWHPTEPTVMRHTTGANSGVGSLTFQETDVVSGATETIADLSSRLTQEIPGSLYLTDRAEGSPSEDGNRHAWMVYNEAEKPIGVVSYDLASDTILGVISIDESPNVDWVSASPSGKYVVASSDAGTHVYDADLSNKRLLTEAIEHSDIGYDANGIDAYVYIDFNSSSATAGWLVSVNMATLERTKIFNIYDDANSSVHISAKNYDMPGWALVSSYNCKVPGAWTCGKVFAVELKPDGRILNLAHTYNCGAGYWTETHAVVNSDFSRVYFNSDSGSCGTDAEVFRIDVPVFFKSETEN